MIFCKLPFMNTNIFDSITIKNETPYTPYISETLNCYINKLRSNIHYNTNQKQLLYLYDTPPSYNCHVPTIIANCNFFTFIEIYRHQPLSYLLNIPICNSYHITSDLNNALDALKCIRCKFANDVNISSINTETSNTFTDECKSTFDLVTCDVNSPTINALLKNIAFALFGQKKGGSFIFKISETCTKQIIDIIVILMNLYSNVIILNTDTCEDLTIEHYIICIKFNGHNEKINEIFHNILLDTTSILELNIKIPHIIINKIENFNSIVGQNKLFLINAIINRSNSDTKNKSDEEKNIKKCITWCDKHYIPCNIVYVNSVN